MRRAITLLLLLGASALLAACSTTDQDSELPWNMPQPWENSPGIPGLEQR